MSSQRTLEVCGWIVFALHRGCRGSVKKERVRETTVVHGVPGSGVRSSVGSKEGK